MTGFEFGGRSRIVLPEIGLGTWRIGGSFTPDHSADESGLRSLEKALDTGYRLIDTAEMYASGNTEQLVGRAIKGRDAQVATKVWQTNLRYDDVLRSAEASRKRLGVKSIFLYQVHWPSDSVPLRETMRAMEKLVEDGKVMHIGVSNFDAELLDEARSCLSREDIVTDQVSYSLVHRDPELELMDYCRKENIGIIAYEPLSRRRVFAGRLGRAIAAVAERTGRTRAQVALNWIISKGAVPIPKASSPMHLEENLHAAGWRLPEREMKALDSASGGAAD